LATYENDVKEEKRRFNPIEFLMALLTILNVATFLMVEREKIPTWYWWSSLVILSIGVAYITVGRYGKSWDAKIDAWRKRRKQNAIAQKHFGEFKDLVRNGRSFTLGIFSVSDRLRGQFEPEIKEKMGLLPIQLIQNYSRNDVEGRWNTLIYRLDVFNEITLRELTLSAEQFDMILRICKKNISLVATFAREMKKEHTIPNHIEKEYDAFREKHNDFMKDCTKYFHKLNQELGEIIVSEHFDYAKKW